MFPVTTPIQTDRILSISLHLKIITKTQYHASHCIILDRLNPTKSFRLCMCILQHYNIWIVWRESGRNLNLILIEIARALGMGLLFN